MKYKLHAVGRSSDVLPFGALGAQVHEVDSAGEAEEAVTSAAKEEGVLIVLSEEFAAAEEAAAAAGRLVVVSGGARGSLRAALEKTRELVTRSVGVDLIARVKRDG